MEYRRSRALSRRQSSHLSTRASTLSIIVFLLVCGVIVFVFCTSQAANWLVENVFAPIFTSAERTEDQKIVSALQSQDGVAQTPIPSATPQPTYSSMTDTLNKRSFYFLQMGSFEDEVQANEKAASIRILGAAGYVHYDGSLYRVFAACYGNDADLTKVQDQIRTDGFENTAYILHSDTIKIVTSGEEEDIVSMRKAIEWLPALPEEMMEYVILFDRDTLSVDQGILKVRDWLRDTESVRKDLDALKDNETVKPVLSAILDYESYLSTFLKIDGKIDAVAFSSLLKSLQIQTIVRYCNITGQDLE